VILTRILKEKRVWPFTKETDIWHVGIAHAPIHAFLDAGTRAALTFHWLPTPRAFTFIADPFAHRSADGTLTIFVEALDYRVKRGEIAYYQLDASGNLCAQGTALTAPVHLSYPYLIEDNGTLYLLPEAHSSGTLTLYRAERFPDQWQRIADLLPLPAIDASVINFENRWWMFFALPGEGGHALRELHIAYADQLIGPWILHPQNPVRDTLNSGRMGGTPFVHEGTLYLPMQDCTRTYGGGMTLLRVTHLSPTHFAAEIATQFGAAGFNPDYPDGIHTVSSCGDITIIDVKRSFHSLLRRAIDWQRRLKRLITKDKRSA
jgi:hypothetical protein